MESVVSVIRVRRGEMCALSALMGSCPRRAGKMRVVCVVRFLSGWNVRPKRLNAYTGLVALAAKSFVS